MWGQQVCSGYACHSICVEDRGQLEGAGSVLSPHGLENQTHCHFYPMSLLTSSLPSFEQSLPEPGVPARLAGHQAPRIYLSLPTPHHYWGYRHTLLPRCWRLKFRTS